MTILSVRGLGDDVIKALKNRSQRDETSVNALVVRLLREGVGFVPAKRTAKEYHDLDALAGTWNKEDESAFEQATKPFSEVDAALWSAGQ